MLKTIDQHYQELACRAHEQAEALADKFMQIIDDCDEDGAPDPDRLCGVRKETDGRRTMVFADPDMKGRSSVIFCVDAILDLADLIRREVVVTDDGGA